MNDQQQQDELGLLMMRIALRGKYGLLEVADKHGITMMQALTVCLLDPEQATPMRSISNYLKCDPSNVTGNVDRLVNAGFIERKEYEKDRRIKNLTMTSQGLALRQTLLRVATEKRLPNLHNLSSTEFGELMRLLDKASDTTI
jgi:DNA-binding MarR family transcriptional regulator